MPSYQKIKDVAKEMYVRGDALDSQILRTLKTCADLVGSTLGPGGMSVVIERQEVGVAPVVTKDGVTVFRAIGFDDPTSQVVMEAARDASVRTANEAGDGTTTATILAEALVRNTQIYCKKYPHESKQKVVRELERLYGDMEKDILKMATPCSLGTEEGRQLLHGVARVSANGDIKLADAVMECFDTVGDEGNVTIIDTPGPSRYEVEKIEGYPVMIGYEDCCQTFYQEFINDADLQMCVLDKPLWILYNGRISDFNDVFPIVSMVAVHASVGKCTPNVIIVATGFSENVLATMAAHMKTDGAIRPYPLLTPRTYQKTGMYDFLLDIAALTGGVIYDPLTNPLGNINALEDLGFGPERFEAGRFRSNIIGYKDEILVLERVSQIEKQLGGDISEFDRQFLKERKAKLTSGIARLIVHGGSNAEVKEKRDRAEDAICAVRGAIKHGALPGAGAVLCTLSSLYNKEDNKVAAEVLAPALLEPVVRLFVNAGYNIEEVVPFVEQITEKKVFDLLKGEWVNPLKTGLVDSLPAVNEAIRNSISVAGLLGTTGGTIVFKRDKDLEASEARDTARWLRDANVNEANIRG